MPTTRLFNEKTTGRDTQKQSSLKSKAPFIIKQYMIIIVNQVYCNESFILIILVEVKIKTVPGLDPGFTLELQKCGQVDIDSDAVSRAIQ